MCTISLNKSFHYSIESLLWENPWVLFPERRFLLLMMFSLLLVQNPVMVRMKMIVGHIIFTSSPPKKDILSYYVSLLIGVVTFSPKLIYECKDAHDCIYESCWGLTLILPLNLNRYLRTKMWYNFVEMFFFYGGPMIWWSFNQGE